MYCLLFGGLYLGFMFNEDILVIYLQVTQRCITQLQMHGLFDILFELAEMLHCLMGKGVRPYMSLLTMVDN